MAQTFHQPDTLKIARAEGKVAVEDLARRFVVTMKTIGGPRFSRNRK
jgi:DeoR/GlpR family transcriptional regulator of sugar metabolism